jgi:glycosyltransferase involved in cell wall biosynthesis
MVRHLCMLPRVQGTAGPANFQKRLEQGLLAREVRVSYDPAGQTYEFILVIGATRNLVGLQRAKLKGIPIIQRLDGMNWIHRQTRTGVRHFLRAEINNLMLVFIRSKMADHVIYQSQFSREWWERVHGKTPVDSSVVYNGVPLNIYTPEGAGSPPQDRIILLMVEGNLSGGYEVGIETGADLVRRLQESVSEPVELHIAGNATAAVRSKWDARQYTFIHWLGLVSPDQIPELERSAHLLYSGDPNPACPNAVIEAMACGLPIIAFRTGALTELVTGDAGRLAEYGANPWELERPDVESLRKGALEVLTHQDRFRSGARRRAVEMFGQDRMVEDYLSVFQGFS